jgi:prepilin-type N-terminal cleavage/methylation domain-containing protein
MSCFPWIARPGQRTCDHARCGARAFTLVELLVVIGVIAVLISLLLPALNKARQSATRVKCMSNMRQYGLAVRMYANDNDDYYPSYWYPENLDASQRTAPEPAVWGQTYFQCGWNYRLGMGKYLSFAWNTYALRQGPFWCPTDDKTPIDPTFLWTNQVPSLSSYRINIYASTNSGAPIAYPGPTSGGRYYPIYPPTKIAQSPVREVYGMRKRQLAPIAVCAVGMYIPWGQSDPSDIWTGGVGWDLVDPSNTKRTSRHARDGSRPVLYSDGHVMFGPFYFTNETFYHPALLGK